MGPPGFVQCFVCLKEFGSRSIEIHWPKCLERWNIGNENLPKSKRETAPVPTTEHPLFQSYQDTMVAPTDTQGQLNRSWPNAQTKLLKNKFNRPSTATLEKPKVLDITLRDAVDMSEMTRDMMEHMHVTSDPPEGSNSSSDYSSDFISSSPSSLGSKSPLEDDITSGDSESESKKRPSTMRLPRPNRNIKVPVITSKNPPRRGTTATIRSFLPRGRRRDLDDAFTGPRYKVKIPEPCLTCGKEQNPERFHSHPKHLVKFKVNTNDKQESKHAVTKPTALKYRSKSLDRDKPRKSDKTSKLKPPGVYATKKSKGERSRKSKSVETSPTSQRKPERKPPESIKKFIEKQKALKKVNQKNGDDFDIEIFTGGDGKSSPQFDEDLPVKSNVKLNQKMKPKSIPKPVKKESINNKDEIPSPQVKNANPLKVCYICGREFGSQSYKFHEPHCIEKWKRENDELPKHLQRAEPKPPEKDLTKEEMNEYAWVTAQAQLVPCENCGRTFFPERLVVHQRGCHGTGGSKKNSVVSKPKEPVVNLEASMNAARPTVGCYICGREFGSRSIGIHEPQCLKKWKQQNDRQPEHLRRPAPEKPAPILDEEGKVDKDAMADAAWQSHLNTLVPCDICGRTFFADRLAKHQPSCKPKS